MRIIQWYNERHSKTVDVTTNPNKICFIGVGGKTFRYNHIKQMLRQNKKPLESAV